MALEHKRQHRGRQLQEEDKANESRELQNKVKKQGAKNQKAAFVSTIELVHFYVWKLFALTHHRVLILYRSDTARQAKTSFGDLFI